MSRTVSVVARAVASIPARAATETWDIIIGLIAPDESSAARQELGAVAGVACSLITDEALRNDALIVYGAGPRVRIYAIYGDDAITGDGVREDALSFDPTDGDWRISLPCPPEDLPWVERSLVRASTRVRARALGSPVPGDGDEAGRGATGGSRPPGGTPVVDLDAFLRR